MDAIPIFSLSTTAGVFRIEADRSIFEIKRERLGMVYVLRNDRFPSFSAVYAEPYDAISAVAKHQTGLAEWDQTDGVAPDDAGKWARRTDKRFQMRLLDAYLTARPTDSLREIVDYFEHRHFYFMERHIICELLTELITTGQLDRLPSMHLAPSELKLLGRIADRWLQSTSEST